MIRRAVLLCLASDDRVERGCSATLQLRSSSSSDEISKSEQKDYDVAKWTVQLTPLDALRIDDRWVYGVAQGNVNTVAYADGVTNSYKTTKTWLFHQEDSGEWLIKRQMWNLK